MMWMRMPAQTWPGATASFVAMWVAMMVPMMLPTVAPVLWRHRQAAAMSGARRPGAITAIAGVAYFSVWAVLGLAVYPVGASVVNLTMHHVGLARAVPIVLALTVTFAGAVQLTPWKARQLSCCRPGSWCDGCGPVGASAAWRHGIRLGLRCVACCANLMVIPLVVGVMDMRGMALVGAAITAERLSDHGERVARVTGLMLVAAGGMLLARAVGA